MVGFLANTVNRVATHFGYDVLTPKQKRRAPSGDVRSEDKILPESGRRQISSDALDLSRNFSACAWAIRKHLDYVSYFDFHARTGNNAIDGQVETLMREYNRPENSDAAGFFTLAKQIRMLEAARVLFGDGGFVKLANGQLQTIEGDRIRNERGVDVFDPENKTRWVQGVQVNRYGRRLQFAIHSRHGNGFVHDRNVRASNFIHHGFFHRPDQVRGVSPLTTALDTSKDIYEGLDYARAKMKVSQLFALAIYSQLDQTAGEAQFVEQESVDLDGDGTNETVDRYATDFGNGPIKLELEPGDRAEFLESKTPSTELQQFAQLSIGIAVKWPDIPYNFWDESHTNFFGSRAAWLLYDRASIDKRADLQEVLRRITIWKIQQWIVDGRLTLPKGWTVNDVVFEWVPLGMPWWDPSNEIRGDLMAIAAGLTTPQQVVRKRGNGDWYDNVTEIANAYKHAEKLGVPLHFDAGTQPTERNAIQAQEEPSEVDVEDVIDQQDEPEGADNAV